MSEVKKKYITIREIDGRLGIQSPHEGELKTIADGHIDFFTKTSLDQIKGPVESRLSGKIEDIGFDEDYSITLEFFPGVKVHILYNNYDDEEDDAFSGSELKFLFSGDKVKWVPSEDLLTLLESSFDYLVAIVESKDDGHVLSAEKSDLLKMSIKQRKEPFKHVKDEDLDELARFVDGIAGKTSNEWTLSKNYFQGIECMLVYDKSTNNIDFKYAGKNLEKINNYAKDQMAIFLMNHCIRFISSKHGVKEPAIVKKMFSFNYQKSLF